MAESELLRIIITILTSLGLLSFVSAVIYYITGGR